MWIKKGIPATIDTGMPFRFTHEYTKIMEMYCNIHWLLRILMLQILNMCYTCEHMCGLSEANPPLFKMVIELTQLSVSLLYHKHPACGI